MANPIVTKIGEASKDAWPLVSAGAAVAMRSAEELARIAGVAAPAVGEYFAKGDGQKIRLRKICEETVWVLAKLGWLRTSGERDVVLAAKAYTDAVADPNASDAELEQLEGQLCDVVGSLPEYLTARITPTTQEA